MSDLPPPPPTPRDGAPGYTTTEGATDAATVGPTDTDTDTDGPTDTATVVQLDPPPRAGELTLPWRIGTALTWIAVVLAMAAVWNASVQLGLSTWWLGPRGDPQPRIVQLAPFVAPALMVFGAINNVRWLGCYGLATSAVLAAVGAGDLDRVGSIAATELTIAGAAAIVSLTSLTGTYLAPAD